jgi:hypothetical protein
MLCNMYTRIIKWLDLSWWKPLQERLAPIVPQQAKMSAKNAEMVSVKEQRSVMTPILRMVTAVPLYVPSSQATIVLLIQTLQLLKILAFRYVVMANGWATSSVMTAMLSLMMAVQKHVKRKTFGHVREGLPLRETFANNAVTGREREMRNVMMAPWLMAMDAHLSVSLKRLTIA